RGPWLGLLLTPSKRCSLLALQPHFDGCRGDDCDVSDRLVGDVEPAFRGAHRHASDRQHRLHPFDIDPLRLLYAHRHVDPELVLVDAEASDEAQRAVMESIFDGPDRRLGVVAAVQVVAGAHLQDHSLSEPSPVSSGTSRYTAAAACATTVTSVPFGVG